MTGRIGVVRKLIPDGSGGAVIAVEQEETGNVAALLVAPGVVRGLAEQVGDNDGLPDLSRLVGASIAYMESSRGVVTRLTVLTGSGAPE